MFVPRPERPRPLLVGAGEGIPTIIEVAQIDADSKPLVLLSVELPCPFRPRPSTILVPGMPDGTIACHPSLDDIGIASRLARSDGYPGCFEGDVTELAAIWLASLDPSALDDVEMIACGPAAMLDAAAAVAQRFGIPHVVHSG